MMNTCHIFGARRPRASVRCGPADLGAFPSHGWVGGMGAIEVPGALARMEVEPWAVQAVSWRRAW